MSISVFYCVNLSARVDSSSASRDWVELVAVALQGARVDWVVDSWASQRLIKMSKV
jgi:hypothetical protein